MTNNKAKHNKKAVEYYNNNNKNNQTSFKLRNKIVRE